MIYKKLKSYSPKMIVMDAGYKTPPIAKQLIDDKITPLFPYTRPKTKKGFFYKKDYVYDEYYDCYLCPEDKVLNYSTTTREGYRAYKSNPHECRNCKSLSRCTESKNHQKVITRHIWQEYLDMCEDIRHTVGMKDVYALRKETIERIFGTAKEFHGMRYTQEVGNAKMNLKIGLTYACMNMKKLANMLWKANSHQGDFLFSKVA